MQVCWHEEGSASPKPFANITKEFNGKVAGLLASNFYKDKLIRIIGTLTSDTTHSTNGSTLDLKIYADSVDAKSFICQSLESAFVELIRRAKPV